MRIPASPCSVTPLGRLGFIVFLLLGGWCVISGYVAAHEVTTCASVNWRGDHGNKASIAPSPSFDGRYVAFQSVSTNLVVGDTNARTDIFIRDRLLRETYRVSVTSNGAQANGDSRYPSISADGRFVAFESDARNLIPTWFGDVNHIFVHDRATGATACISVDSNGVRATLDCTAPSISSDGRFVVFTSRAPNLVPGDTNNMDDVFVRDRLTGKTTRVSVDSSGNEANNKSGAAVISANGRYVAFDSRASNLVPNDSNGTADVFVHDQLTGQTTRVSVDSGGGQAYGDSLWPAISGNGRFVAFDSIAGDLVPGDLIGVNDVFLHDCATGSTLRISVGYDGTESLGFSGHPKISADGSVMAYVSVSPNIVPNPENGFQDVYIHDRATGQTRMASVSSDGVEGWEHSYIGDISADGRHVTFFSLASNLTTGDTNQRKDVFVRGGEFTLETDLNPVSAGDIVTLTTYEGLPGHTASLWVVGANGAPVLLVALGTFSSDGKFTKSITVPAGPGPRDVTLRAYCIDSQSMIEASNDLVVSVQ